MQTILPIMIAYFLGAIPFGLLLGFIAGEDIRKQGSGNIGATNTLRICGAKFGVPALILDILKGYAPVAWIAPLFLADSTATAANTVLALTALAAIAGHNFPIYLKFKGGKGVATSAGALLGLLPQATGVGLVVFFLMVSLTRYVSLSSTCAAIAVVTTHNFFEKSPYGEALPVTLLVWLILVLVVVRHRSNYRRLWLGTENKLGKKADPPQKAPAAEESQA
ncbi:MAG: glycerol-3-phosphate 1-O-acyltransferase PlsY [Planctomycetes bacterium]|nr:glycerol-3-phosphate 1-O-acyltransferase PlsY [Planctomycetota bacterium]